MYAHNLSKRHEAIKRPLTKCALPAMCTMKRLVVSVRHSETDTNVNALTKRFSHNVKLCYPRVESASAFRTISCFVNVMERTRKQAHSTLSVEEYVRDVLVTVS